VCGGDVVFFTEVTLEMVEFWAGAAAVLDVAVVDAAVGEDEFPRTEADGVAFVFD